MPWLILAAVRALAQHSQFGRKRGIHNLVWFVAFGMTVPTAKP
jgi:hypothetical protein